MKSNTSLKIFSLIIVISLASVIFFSPLQAQYFGRNKVQYEKFHFKIMKTKHFDIYFYPEEQEAVEIAARLAERWYARLSRLLNHELKGRQPLIIYSSQPHFQQTTAIQEILGEGTGGVTEVYKRRIVLPFGASLAETDHVIGHELVHAFQFSLTSLGSPRSTGTTPAIFRLPNWFIEGLAEYLSIGPDDPHTAMWMRDAMRRKEIPEIKKLDNPRYFPYRYGHGLWAYITGRWGDQAVAKLMNAAARVGDYEMAIEKGLGANLKALSKDWLEAMKTSYEPLISMTDVTDQASRILVKGTEKTYLNISPSISPDGKEVIFLSTRDLFSVDMFQADAETGKVKRKIITTAVDPRFESLQFIKSAGAWDSEGKRFAFGAVVKGKPVLTLYNVEKETIEREISFSALGEIFNPTWSPDGRFIAFAALSGGLSDIYIYDFERENLRRLTSDAFADLQPAWSPDGRAIAFTTDRFTTNLSVLSIGNYELALLDPVSGEVKKLESFKYAKNINPQWSPDSRSLFFLSDQSGKTDIYRLELDSGRIYQITNLFTGVSGISELSPAISVAQKTGRLTYSCYDDGNYSIFAIESSQALAGKPTLAQFGNLRVSVLPPRTKPEGALLGLLKNPFFGLPEETKFEVSDYKPRLTLDYISPPNLAIGVDRWGTYGGGGMALFWSDMLGYHTLATMVESSTRLKDSALLVGYQNTQRRWNWGAVAYRIPYIIGSYGAYYDFVYGEPAIVEVEHLYRQINYELSGIIYYPFNQVRRLEFNLGFRYLDFDEEILTNAYSYYTNARIFHDIQKLPSPPGIYFGFASAALIYDSALFGATSPVIGQSYILEFTPQFGNLSFYSLLGDYRRYIVPMKPFTLAFRVLHFGRYGKGGEDERLWPLYIGYENLVRGYDVGFDAREWSEFGPRLFGSKILVANAELRFPLLGILGLGKGYYGAFPIEFFGFYDWGVAWDEENKAWFLGGDRKPISSTGIGVRINVFGYMVLGVNYVRPLDRANKGWLFQLSFYPGF